MMLARHVQKILESLSIPMCVSDYSGNVIMHNPRFRECTTSPTQSSDRQYRLTDGHGQPFHATITTKVSNFTAWINVGPDGKSNEHTRQVDLKLVDPDDELLLGTLRIRTWEQERIDRLEDMVNVVREDMLLLDAQDVIIEANPSFCNKIGATRAEISGICSSSLTPDYFKPAFFSYIQCFRQRLLTRPLELVTSFRGSQLVVRLHPLYHGETYEGVLVTAFEVSNLIRAGADVSRGRLPLEQQGFDPRRLARSLISRIAKRAKTKEMTVSALVSASVPPTIIADRRRIERILSELLDNAVVHTNRGRVDLVIGIHHMVAGSSRIVLRFCVSDSGTGLEIDATPEIVWNPTGDEKLLRDSDIDAEASGLIRVRAHVERLGGELGFRAEAGRGTCLWVNIPVERLTGIDSSDQRPDWRHEPFRVSSPMLKLLLLDPDDITGTLAFNQIKELGHLVDWAKTSTEARELSRFFVYDIFVISGTKGGGDVRENISSFRRKEHGIMDGNTPIVIISSRVDRNFRASMVEAGVDDFLERPFDAIGLNAVLSRNVHRLKMPARINWNSEESGLLNMAQLYDWTAGDVQLAEELLRELVEHIAPEQQQLMEQAAASGDTLNAAEHADRLRAACEPMGAMRLMTIAREIAHAWSDQDATTALKFTTQLQQTLAAMGQRAPLGQKS